MGQAQHSNRHEGPSPKPLAMTSSSTHIPNTDAAEGVRTRTCSLCSLHESESPNGNGRCRSLSHLVVVCWPAPPFAFHSLPLLSPFPFRCAVRQKNSSDGLQTAVFRHNLPCAKQAEIFNSGWCCCSSEGPDTFYSRS